MAWLGFNRVFGIVATSAEKVGWEIRESSTWMAAEETFPGISKEFMPLDEGSFLLMPTSMPSCWSATEQTSDSTIDMLLANIPGSGWL